MVDAKAKDVTYDVLTLTGAFVNAVEVTFQGSISSLGNKEFILPFSGLMGRLDLVGSEKEIVDAFWDLCAAKLKEKVGMSSL